MNVCFWRDFFTANPIKYRKNIAGKKERETVSISFEWIEIEIWRCATTECVCGESVNLRQTNCNRCICLHFTYVWVRECLYLIDPRCELEMIDVECNYLTGRLYSLCVFVCCVIGLELERERARKSCSSQ